MRKLNGSLPLHAPHQIEVPLQIGLLMQSSSVAVDLDAPGFAFVDTIRSPVCSKGMGSIMSSVKIRPRKSGESCGIVGRSRFVAYHMFFLTEIFPILVSVRPLSRAEGFCYVFRVLPFHTNAIHAQVSL